MKTADGWKFKSRIGHVALYQGGHIPRCRCQAMKRGALNERIRDCHREECERTARARFLRGAFDRDLDNLRPFLDEDGLGADGEGYSGRGHYKGNQIIDDFLGPVRGMFAAGDPKVSHRTSSRTAICRVESYSVGKLQDGKEYNNRYCWTFRMNNGKIGLLREYMDSHYVATLFGL